MWPSKKKVWTPPALTPSPCVSEGVHRLCPQCEASDPLHASEPTHLPVPPLALRGVALLRVHRAGHDRSEHHRTDDEGEGDEERENTAVVHLIEN